MPSMFPPFMPWVVWFTYSSRSFQYLAGSAVSPYAFHSVCSVEGHTLLQEASAS